METKRIEVSLNILDKPSLQWTRLWDLLLTPLQDQPSQKAEAPSVIQTTSGIKPRKKSVPLNQLSLFPLEKSEAERYDPRPQREKEGQR